MQLHEYTFNELREELDRVCQEQDDPDVGDVLRVFGLAIIGIEQEITLLRQSIQQTLIGSLPSIQPNNPGGEPDEGNTESDRPA